MALDPKLITRLKQDVADLNKLYGQLGKKPIKIDFDKADLKTLKDIKEKISEAQVYVDDLSFGFGSLARGIRDAVREWKPGFGDTSKEITQALVKLKGLSEKLQDDAKGINVLDKGQLETLKDQIQSQIEKIETQKKELEEEIKLGEVRSTGQKLTEREIEDRQRILENLENEFFQTSANLGEELTLTEALLKKTRERLKSEERINTSLGLTGKLIGGLDKLLGKLGFGGLGEGIEVAKIKMRELAEELTYGGVKSAKFTDMFKVGLKGVGSLMRSVIKSLKDPLVVLGALTVAFKTLWDMGTHFSHSIREVSKNFMIGHSSALQMTQELKKMSLASSNILATTDNLIEAQFQLNESLGTNVLFNQKQLETQIRLNKIAGLTNEEASAFLEYSLLTGKSQEVIFDEIGAINKGVLSNRKVLQETLSINGQLAVLYGNNPIQISKAVTQAQRMGLTLEQTRGIAKGLLDFESSITAELEAELLTGKQINLEQARYLALMGDTAGAAELVLKQVGSLGNFQNMNVIQQEAYAKALGMGVDELSNSLIKQEKLNALGKDQKELLQKRIQNLKDAGRFEEAALLEANALKYKNVKLAEMELDANERLSQAGLKFKSSISALVAGPLGKAVELVADIVESLSLGLGTSNQIGDSTQKLAKNVGASKAGFDGILGVVKSISSALGWVISKTTKFLGLLGNIPIMGDALKGLAGAGAILLGLKSLGGLFKFFTKGTLTNPMITRDISGGAGGGIEDTLVGGGKSGKTGGPLRDKKGRFISRARSQKIAKTAGRLGTVASIAPTAMALTGGLIQSRGEKLQEEGKNVSGTVTSNVGESLTQTGTKGVASQLLKFGANMVGKGASFLGKLNPTEIVKKSFGKFGGKLTKVLPKFLKGLPGIGGALELVLAGRDVNNLMKEGKPREELEQLVGKRSLQALGSIIGSVGGGTLVQALNIVPGLGVALTPVAALAGDFIGRSLMGLLADTVGAKPLGKIILNTFGPKTQLAKGGIVTQPTRALVGEAGPEIVLPLDKFYSKIDKLIHAVNSRELYSRKKDSPLTKFPSKVFYIPSDKIEREKSKYPSKETLSPKNIKTSIEPKFNIVNTNLSSSIKNLVKEKSKYPSKETLSPKNLKTNIEPRFNVVNTNLSNSIENLVKNESLVFDKIQKSAFKTEKILDSNNISKTNSFSVDTKVISKEIKSLNSDLIRDSKASETKEISKSEVEVIKPQQISLDKLYVKIDELIGVVKQGGNVFLDGNKVGKALALGTSRMG